MKIGIYDPYLDTLGGGEKYVLDIATFYAREHDVSIFWNPKDREQISQQASERFHLNLDNIQFVPNIFHKTSSMLQKYQQTSQFDVLFLVSDGSIPFLFARRNYLIIQHPINWVAVSLVDKVKLLNIKKVICYSYFVKHYLDKTLHTSSLVIPPVVESVYREHQQKTKMILSVGRFTKHMNAKKQDVLIDAFIQMRESIPGWELVICGGLKDEDQEYFQSLEEKANGFPIRLLPNISREQLIELYNQATIYWHATGYGEDIIKHPERTEHFGITTIEAMSAGCIPVVFEGGGQAEIVHNAENGFVWKEINELQEKTKEIIAQPEKYTEIRANAIDSASRFNGQKFHHHLDALLRK